MLRTAVKEQRRRRDHLHRGRAQPGARRAVPPRRDEEAGRGRRHPQGGHAPAAGGLTVPDRSDSPTRRGSGRIEWDRPSRQLARPPIAAPSAQAHEDPHGAELRSHRPRGAAPARVPRRSARGSSSRVVVAVAAQFLSDHYGAPAMLMALLLGIAFHFLAEEGRCVEGINFTARHVLRIGVALLGARISVELLIGLGPRLIALVVAGGRPDHPLRPARRAPARPRLALRASDRRVGGDLRRLGRHGDRRGPAPQRAFREQPDLHRAGRHGAEHHRDDRLSAGLRRRRPRRPLRPASSSAAPSTTWRRSSAPASRSRTRPARPRRSSSSSASRCSRRSCWSSRSRSAARGLAEDGGGKRPPLVPGFVLGFLALAAVNSLGLVPAAVAALHGRPFPLGAAVRDRGRRA